VSDAERSTPEVAKAATGERLTLREVLDLPSCDSEVVREWKAKIIRKFSGGSKLQVRPSRDVLSSYVAGDAGTVRLRVAVEKADPSRHLIFGWASVAEIDGEPVVDKQGDIIPPEELENAAYGYVLSSRVGDAMHEREQVSTMIESVVFTREKQATLGIDLGRVGWWVGYYVDDQQVWQGIEKGEFQEFSIECSAERHEVAT
jgi:hypothetical protein